MKKTLVVMLLLSFIAFTLLTAVLVAAHAGHGCIEEICIICKIIKVLEQFRKAVTFATVLSVVFISAGFHAKESDLMLIFPANPVEANVRLNN
ncbi:MAG: hypothetical protein FWD48_11765 [Oscillospiraceae bacterium]|nr:hypothetical protein [Oscillospiraceae bacterium]